MKRPFRLTLLTLALAAAAAQAEVTLAVKPVAADFLAAFYVARGFSAEAAAVYARECVLGFTFKNDGAAALRVDLADWTAGGGVRLRPREQWEQEWERRGVAKPARIAFRFAQFPPQQEFEPGDWIMGMATLEHRIPGPFRIAARYSDARGHHEFTSNAVTCPE